MRPCAVVGPKFIAFDTCAFLLVWKVTLGINFSYHLQALAAAVGLFTCLNAGFFISFPQVEIHHASEVDEIFDAISYDKGASVIRMLQNYLGADRFQVWIGSPWNSISVLERWYSLVPWVSIFCFIMLFNNIWNHPDSFTFCSDKQQYQSLFYLLI